MAASSSAVYDPRGLILFMRGRTVMAQPFHAKRLETTGDAYPVAEQVDNAPGSLAGGFSISGTGVLAYFSGGQGGIRQLTWFDRAGRRQGTVGPPGTVSSPAISPDGTTVAVARMDVQSGRSTIWLHDLAHDTTSRFTFGAQGERSPAWSPDGSRLVYVGSTGVYMKAVSGAAQEELLYKVPRVDGASWSRDGKFLFLTRLEEKTDYDLWVLPNPLDSGVHTPYALLQTTATERYGAELSPDGKYLAYTSTENGSYQIYVLSFPDKKTKIQISSEGGVRPIWSRDGKELFYHAHDGRIMAVDVKTGPRFEHGVPRALFVLPTDATARFDVSPDGKRFLAPVSAGDAGNTTLTVVLNWHAGVKK